MSEVKALIDEYAAEAAMRQAQISELATALVLVTAQLGTGKKHEIKVPAAVRKLAKTISHVHIDWSQPTRFTEVGSVRLTPEFRPPEGEE